MDESIDDLKLHLEVNFLNYFLDSAVNRVTKRFKQLKEHTNLFLFLYEIVKSKI